MHKSKRKAKDVEAEEIKSHRPALRERNKQMKPNYVIDSESEEDDSQSSPCNKSKKVQKQKGKSAKNRKKVKQTKRGRKNDSDSDFEAKHSFLSEESEEIDDLDNSDSEITSEVSSVIKSKNKNKPTKRNNRNNTMKSLNDGNKRNKRLAKSNKNLIPSTIIIEENKSSGDGISVNNMDELEDSSGLEIPSFIKKDYIRDANLRRPDDPDYDPSTVHIPEEEFEKLTPLMKQYWGVKSKYYDSVIFVRMWHWYWVFYHDITILNLLSNTHLKISNCMEGFYGTQKEKYIKLFTDNDYKVVVFEQTENVSLMIN